MRIFCDSAEIADIRRYATDPCISGFTTNATLVKRAGANVDDLVEAAGQKEISVEFGTCEWRPNVRWKVTDPTAHALNVKPGFNLTAICSEGQVPALLHPDNIVSVFAGRIMDTGRSPERIIRLARRTCAEVLWASSRSVYDITQAEIMGCDIITVTPAIFEKYREWHDMPLEEVAARTIAQFDADR